jgi:AraC-like DNA-binding protein
MTASYVERPPVPELAGAVRTVWVQRTGDAPYRQRHLPTGGVEMHFPIGGRPQLIGPLTGPQVEVIPAGTTLLGVRFRPGMAPPLPAALDELVDQRVDLAELWGSIGERLAEAVTSAPGPTAALKLLQAHLAQAFRRAGPADPLMCEAVRRLMPWRPVDVGDLAEHLAISASQLRRRCLRLVGLSPKTLQRTLRFQGFLALARAGGAADAPARAGGVGDVVVGAGGAADVVVRAAWDALVRAGGVADVVAGAGGAADVVVRAAADVMARPGAVAGGLARLAVEAGYADHAHLSRECARLSGLSPRDLLGGDLGRCECGHDHSASYRPFLAGRREDARFVQARAAAAS